MSLLINRSLALVVRTNDDQKKSAKRKWVAQKMIKILDGCHDRKVERCSQKYVPVVKTVEIKGKKLPVITLEQKKVCLWYKETICYPGGRVTRMEPLLQ